MLKYKIEERIEWKQFVIQVFSVIGKTYLLVRIFKDGVCIHQEFASSSTWAHKLDVYFKSIGVETPKDEYDDIREEHEHRFGV